jgi:hypothetical protein
MMNEVFHFLLTFGANNFDFWSDSFLETFEGSAFFVLLIIQGMEGHLRFPSASYFLALGSPKTLAYFMKFSPDSLI